MQCVAVWCNVLQCGAVCSVLQLVAVCCNACVWRGFGYRRGRNAAVKRWCGVLLCGVVCCSVQFVAVRCSLLQCECVDEDSDIDSKDPQQEMEKQCNVLQCSVCVAMCCSVVQCGAVWCSVLQCVAALCSVV